MNQEKSMMFKFTLKNSILPRSGRLGAFVCLHKNVISVQYKAEQLISVIDLVEAMVEYIRNYHLIK